MIPYNTAGFTLTPAEQNMSDQVIACWTNFAHTGNPNGADLPMWSKVNDTNRAQSLAPGSTGIRPVDLGAEHHCDFWATVPSSSAGVVDELPGRRPRRSPRVPAVRDQLINIGAASYMRINAGMHVLSQHDRTRGHGDRLPGLLLRQHGEASRRRP